MAYRQTTLAGGTGRDRVIIDAAPFIKFCTELQKKLPTSNTFGEVFEAETLSVLQTCARKIKRSSKAKAGGKFNPRSRNFSGWVRMNGKFYWVKPTSNGNKGRRYSDAMWNKLMNRLKQVRKRAEARVGLSKALFYRVAKELRLRRYGQGWPDDKYIDSALNDSGGIGSPARSGPVWSRKRVCTTAKNLKAKSPYLKFTISSTNTFNPFTGGTGIVMSSFRGREKYFEKGVKHGIMDDTKKIAEHYPKIDIKDS